MFDIDPLHAKIDVMESRMVSDVWRDKYRWKDEATINDTFARVGDAIYAQDSETPELAINAMVKGLWVPGGRILAGAGTEKRVTLMNCYVNEKVGDAMEGIMDALRNTCLTLQQGGGIGTDFSTLRPEGALLTRTHTKASGPMPFMLMWDRASATIRSAGDRRGAMMGTMCDTHPDLPKFIKAKNEPNVLTQFNMSVLISDAFMEAVKDDVEWVLFFSVPPCDRDDDLIQYDFIDEATNEMQYAYSVWQARDLWRLITENTYEFSEPGVIFIDRVNELNNLHYCEDIRCTNPCGEQPLPPHGTCNLGHVNLARCVRNPFTPEATIDFKLIREITRMGVRFLDNVIDVSLYPLDEQAAEERSKRRLGLGFTGLADLLSQCKVRYGSPDAVRITEEITRAMCWEAYDVSADLAAEKGPFPMYDEDEYLSGYTFVNTMLPAELKAKIKKHGIRNALLMTVAPTGTGSIIVGNVSSGGEPVFLHQSMRRVLKPTTGFGDEHETYVEWGYGAKLWAKANGYALAADPVKLPSYMVTAEDISIEDHVVMQAAAQRNIDASISKTINVPKDTPYERFAQVYELAYSLGCKGCTTYRPSDVRGSILSKPGNEAATIPGQILERPPALPGTTYKLRWPSMSSALYLTINSANDGRPYECFISSKDAKYHDWATALTVMITAIFRMTDNPMFVTNELQQIQSLHDNAFIDKKHHPSLAAYIGFVMEGHIQASMTHAVTRVPQVTGERCPDCKQLSLIKAEGCTKCTCCNFTTCG